MSARILLISNSTQYGRGYLDHAEEDIRRILQGVKRVLFVPHALLDHAGYAATARKRFSALGIALDSLHEAADPRDAVGNAQAVFIGGGNTFRLLKALYDLRLLESIRDRLRAGMPYIGSSAGSNVACPTIRTTNDMPITEPPSLAAMGLVSFQLNPHYLDSDPDSRHMGETREERIQQYLEENALPVCGLREGGMLDIEGSAILLKGARARIFRRGQQPAEAKPGERLDALLAAGSA